jgi:hypothetical protein
MAREPNFKKILADQSIRFHMNEVATGKKEPLTADHVMFLHNVAEHCEDIVITVSQADGRQLNLADPKAFKAVYTSFLEKTGAKNLRELKENHPQYFSVLKTFEAVAPHCGVHKGKFQISEAVYNETPNIFGNDFILN